MRNTNAHRKVARGKNWNRDIHGRPCNRSSTWGRKDKCPKRNRRNWRKEF